MSRGRRFFSTPSRRQIARRRNQSHLPTRRSDQKPYRAGQCFAGPPRLSVPIQRTERSAIALCQSAEAFLFRRRNCGPPAIGRLACPDLHPENKGSTVAVQRDFSPGHQKNRRETTLDERSVSSARRFYWDAIAEALRDSANFELRHPHRLHRRG